MTTYQYTVLVERTEEGKYRAVCPAMPGCRAIGDTNKEAIRNIKLSIRYRIEKYTASGRPIPRDCSPAA